MGSGPQTIEKTEQYHPSKGEQPMYQAGYEQGYGLNQNPQAMYPNQTFVGASPFTQAGLFGQAGLAPSLMGYGGDMGQSWQRGLNASDVANNSYVNNMMDVNAQKVNQNLQRNLLPSIQQGAVQSGGSNNARQGLAQGQAMGDTQQGLANANAMTQLGAYGQGLQHEQGMMGQAGNLVQMLMSPYAALQDAGKGIEGYQQQALNDAMQRFYYPRQEAEGRLDTMLGRLGSLRTGANVGSQPNPNYESPFTSALRIGAGIGGTAMGLPVAGGGSVGGNWLSGLFNR